MMSYHMILSYDMILENFRRTENREQTDPQTENSITEATLIPCGSWGERANKWQGAIRYGGHILHWSRIRKNITHRQRTENR